MDDWLYESKTINLMITSGEYGKLSSVFKTRAAGVGGCSMV